MSAGEAFRYALERVEEAPGGRWLWLLGEPGVASGEVYQPWYRAARMLREEGCSILTELKEVGRDYDAVFVQGSKQVEETEGLLALAFERSRGFVMAGAANDAGGGRLMKMLEAYGVEVSHLSKSKCRVVWTTQAGRADRELLAKKLACLEMRQVEMGGELWWSQPGLFGWNKVDTGTALLVDRLPGDLAGKVADFGCGYGYLSAMVARRFAGVESIDAYDADARAVACCLRNNGAKVRGIWQDVAELEANALYDAVVMNPPFHEGKSEEVGLGAAFVRRAWQSLKPGGRLFMVANRHLRYEGIVPELGVLVQEGGYKIMAGRKP